MTEQEALEIVAEWQQKANPSEKPTPAKVFYYLGKDWTTWNEVRGIVDVDLGPELSPDDHIIEKFARGDMPQYYERHWNSRIWTTRIDKAARFTRDDARILATLITGELRINFRKSKQKLQAVRIGDLPLEYLEISVRTSNALYKFLDEWTLDALLKVTELQLLKSPRGARKVLNEVKSIVGELGFSIPEE